MKITKSQLKQIIKEELEENLQQKVWIVIEYEPEDAQDLNSRWVQPSNAGTVQGVFSDEMKAQEFSDSLKAENPRSEFGVDLHYVDSYVN